MVGGWLEDSAGAGQQEHQLSSGLQGLHVWKRQGALSRCMGIQESLHMHQNQTA